MYSRGPTQLANKTQQPRAFRIKQTLESDLLFQQWLVTACLYCHLEKVMLLWAQLPCPNPPSGDWDTVPGLWGVAAGNNGTRLHLWASAVSTGGQRHSPSTGVLWGNGKGSLRASSLGHKSCSQNQGVTANLCVSTWSGCGSLDLQEVVLLSSVSFLLRAVGVLEAAGMCCVGLEHVSHDCLHIKAASMSVLDTGLIQDGLMGRGLLYFKQAAIVFLVLTEICPSFLWGEDFKCIVFIQKMNPWMASGGVLEVHYWANQEELDKQMVFGCKLLSQVKTGFVVPVSYATCPS